MLLLLLPSSGISNAKQKDKNRRFFLLSLLPISLFYYFLALLFFSHLSHLSCLTVFFSSALNPSPTAFETNFAGFAVRNKQTTLSLSLHHPLFLSHTQVGICQRYKGARRGHCKSFLQTWSLHIQHNQRS